MELQTLDIKKVIPTPDNPRRTPKTTDPEIKELAESILAHGLLQPVIVRPHPKKDGYYDLRAGERRFVAHQALGVDSILAFVRDLDDAAALEVTVLENLQREDLSPLEEGKSVDLLLKSGKDPKAIAADIGKHVSWVYKRARLTHLTEKWRKAVEDPEHQYNKLSAGHLACIAWFEEDVQDKLYNDLYAYSDEAVKDWDRQTHRCMMFLKDANWKLDDADLVKSAGACTECSKRTSVNPDLFATSDKKVDAADRCLDQACFKKKEKAEFKAKADKVREKYPDAVEIKTDYYGSGTKNALRPYNYDKAKKSDKGAVPAIVTDGKKPGTLTWVKVKKQSTTTGKSKANKETLATKRKALGLKRWREVGQMVGEKLLEVPLNGLGENPLQTMLCLLAAFGTGDHWESKPWSLYLEFTSGAKDATTALWIELRQYLSAEVTEVWNDNDIEMVSGMAKLVGLDVDATFKQVCELDEFKEPPEWTAKKKSKKSKK